jgi:D-serine deaminase-like pyridoxal phosphate-dependent protein
MPTIDAPKIGDTIDALDTPSIVIDLSAMEENIARLMARLASSSKRVRPHLKTVKSPHLAQKLLDAGATGCCVAKVSEAEVMTQAGISDLLITSEVVGKVKIGRLLNLASQYPNVKVVVDSAEGAQALNSAISEMAEPIKLQVLIELNVGQNRAGVALGEEATNLARYIAGLGNLTLVGVQGYEGHLQHLASDERQRLCREAMNKLCDTVKLIRTSGMPLEIVTTGGTGTCEICAQFDDVTEVQPGSFVFMDVAYRNAIGPLYANALSVISTVISRPIPERAIIDAGLKSLSNDMGNAELKNDATTSYRPGGDEHGILTCSADNTTLAIGARVEMIPSHIDTTVNLFDTYYGIRNGVIEEIWPILGRGKVQ